MNIRAVLLGASLLGGAALLHGQQGEFPQGSGQAYHGVQANAAQNRSLHQTELEVAAQKAREERALKAAMASQSMSQRPTYTTAEQFMQANPPRITSRQNEEGSAAPAGSRDNSVPTFQGPAAPRPAPAPVSSSQAEPALHTTELPTRRGGGQERARSGGLLGRIFGRDDSDAGGNEEVFATSFTEEDRMIAGSSDPGMAVADVGDVTLPSQSDAPNRPQRSSTPAASKPKPAPVAEKPVGAPARTSTASAASTSETPPAPPASASSSAPKPPANTKVTEVARVAQAEVDGIMVTLFEGDQVGVLGKEGDKTKIRLPDGRTGMLNSSDIRTVSTSAADDSVGSE